MTLRLVQKAPSGFRGVSVAPANEAWRALHHAADQNVPELVDAVLGWAASQRVNRPAVRAALERESPEIAVQLASDWDREAVRLERRLVQPLVVTFEAGGSAGERTTVAKRHNDPRLEGLFDMTNPRAAGWARLYAALMVTRTVMQQRAALRKVIEVAQRRGLSLRTQEAEILAMLDAGMGLDSVRAGALARFRQRLVERGLDEATIADRVNRLRNRYLRDRAHTIARHETMTAASAGKWELWQQAREAGLMPDFPQKRRIVTPDDRLCPICAPMGGQVKPLDEPFVSPFNGATTMHGPLHVQCRCDEVLVIEDEDL